MAELLFYRHKYGKPLDRVIGWLSWGPYSHVEFKLSDSPRQDGPCISASWRDRGVRYKTIDPRNGRWKRFRINPDKLSAAQEVEIAEWFADQRGRKYDTLGVLAVPFTFWRHKLFRLSRWFCSEICAHILRKWQVKELPTCQLSPNRLARICGDDPVTFAPIRDDAPTEVHADVRSALAM